MPKRKRVIREDEDEDQVWFSKRPKKSTTAQQDESHIASTTPGETAVDSAQIQPPIENKPAKRKVVRKRILVPKSRQKAPTDPEPEPQPEPQPRPDQLPVAPEPTAEDVTKPKRKTRAKALVVLKNKPNRVDVPIEPLQDDGREDESNNHPLHDIPSVKPATFEKIQSNGETPEGVAEPKKRTKAVVRKRVVRKDIQEDTANERPNLKEDANPTAPSIPLEKEKAEEIPKAKVTKKRKVIKKHVNESVEQEVISDTQAILTNSMEGLPPTLEMTESVQAEKKRKIVKRVRVPRATKTKVLPEKEDHKPAVSEAEDADLALFESEAPVPVTKKATKAPKRVFNDDSEIDLDHMLSGIAAMAGTGAAKPSITKPTRVAKRKAAVS